MEINHEWIKTIKSICVEAGTAIMDVYTSLQPDTIRYKSDRSPVTDADLKSDVILKKGLSKLSDRIPVLSEESEWIPYAIRQNWKSFWLVDPLDGTSGFIRKSGEFVISIALIHDNFAHAGFIYHPVSKRFYFAWQDAGAFEDNGREIRQMKVSSFYLNAEGIKVLASRNHPDAQTNEWIQALSSPDVIQVGSAMKFVWIASGKADIYPRLSRIMEWDTAAGQIIIEEAGGKFVDVIQGKRISYNSPDLINPPFLTSGIIINNKE